MQRTERNSDEKAKLQLLDDLTDMLFIGRLLILKEIFKHVSAFSLLCQTVNILSWELREAEDKLLAAIDKACKEASGEDGTLCAEVRIRLHARGGKVPSCAPSLAVVRWLLRQSHQLK